VAKLEAAARDEDPRLSFSTPEFKEAQRAFTDGFKVSVWIECGCVKEAGEREMI
jgi:hypothetical protein